MRLREDLVSAEAGVLAVVIGADGSGKTSVLAELRRRRADWSFASIDPADLYPIPGLDYMNWALDVHPRTYAARMGSLSRASYLAHTLGLLHDERLTPALDRGGIVVCDSYHYRVRAKEHLLGSAGAALLDALAECTRSPDLIVWLEVPLVTAWRRNGCSCNFYEAIGECSWDGFRRMQAGVRRLVLTRYAADVPVRCVDATRPIRQVADDVIAAIAAIDERAARAADPGAAHRPARFLVTDPGGM